MSIPNRIAIAACATVPVLWGLWWVRVVLWSRRVVRESRYL